MKYHGFMDDNYASVDIAEADMSVSFITVSSYIIAGGEMFKALDSESILDPEGVTLWEKASSGGRHPAGGRHLAGAAPERQNGLRLGQAATIRLRAGTVFFFAAERARCEF